MDFSWATISLIDIGIFSFGVIAAATGWIVKKREDKRYNALQQELIDLQSAADQRYNTLQQEFSNFQSAADQRYNVLKQEHENLQQEFSNFQSAADQRYNVLKQEHENLQQEFSNFQSAADQRYNALQQEHEILKEENATLRAGLDALTREHKALQTAHDRLSGRHAELVERVMPVFEILAREKLMEINARNEN
ncbi:MAG: hypothetical protein OYL97_02705 [Candidatus Poribacteria bacterium]|nr:hypothetical protein [Candidatus Poribacteria bacterium]